MLGPVRPTQYRFRLGGFEIAMLNDGARTIEGPYPTFGEDQEPEKVAECAGRNFLPSDRMENSYTPLLINTGHELVLFDSGNPATGQPEVGNLPWRLIDAGYAPEQIDVVVLTHCHPDHVGGLWHQGEATYPNARYVVGRVEYDWWMSDSPIGTPREGQVEFIRSMTMPLASKMTFLEDGHDVVPGISAVAAYGHSPGHLNFHVESEDRRFFVFADVANHHAISFQKPEWHFRLDQDKDLAVATRKRILDMLAAEAIPATGYHMPFPAVGFVKRRAECFRWVPATYQLHV